MNKQGWLLLCLLAAGPALAEEPAAPPAPAPAPAAPAGDQSWQIGYTLGYSLGQRMSADLDNLDTNAFHEGFSDAFARNPGKMTQEQMQAAF